MIDFFIINWKTVIPISISSMALLFSLISVLRTRKTLHVEFDKSAEIFLTDEIFILSKDGSEFSPQGDGILTKISVVNNSSIDIGYFDLRAFDYDTNQNIYLITRKALGIHNKEASIYHRYPQEDYYEMEIPDKNHGMFKANSYTVLNLIIFPKYEVKDRIAISFKIPKKILLRRDKFAVTKRKKYKHFYHDYDVTGLKEMQQERRKEIAEHKLEHSVPGYIQPK